MPTTKPKEDPKVTARRQALKNLKAAWEPMFPPTESAGSDGFMVVNKSGAVDMFEHHERMFERFVQGDAWHDARLVEFQKLQTGMAEHAKRGRIQDRFPRQWDRVITAREKFKRTL